ncbi:Kielin/chordin-like protein, partial [Chelonia mydas]
PACVWEGTRHEDGATWDRDSCTACICLQGEGEVSCGPLPCPGVTCPHPAVGPCDCPVCDGCSFHGRACGNGERFPDPHDACQLCSCLGGDVLCVMAPCPPLTCTRQVIEPGDCCPRCKGCTYDGQGHADGTSWFSSPCVSCLCTHGIATCARIRCLGSCLQPVQLPGECCPLCADCMFEGRPYSPGESFQPSLDPCEICTCEWLAVGGPHVRCYHRQCPRLVGCPRSQIQLPGPQHCCPTCAQCVIEAGERRVSDGESWMDSEDDCVSCTCHDETPALTPGMCCPRCLPRPATCLAFGDPHYRTFDGRALHFQGTCTYVLAQDCQREDFSIHVTNDDRGRPGVAWTKEVTVRVGDTVVQLLQDWLVRVDGQVVTLPFLKEPHLYVERQTNTVLLNTNIGVKVLWSGRSQLEVSVPGTYKGHTCGLCGNFNGHPQDDARLRSGQLARSEAAFGNSWRVSGGTPGTASQVLRLPTAQPPSPP